MMMAQDYFDPIPEVRAFDIRVLEGQETTVEYRAIRALGQSVALREQKVFEYDLGGLVKVSAEPEGSTAKDKIVEAWLVGAHNGGRNFRKKAKTYAEFFDERQRKAVIGQCFHGLAGRLGYFYRGDANRADILIRLESGIEFYDSCWDLISPGEWYSEHFEDYPGFKFEKGFYPDADVAWEEVKKDRCEGMFGERDFPVAVWPLGTPLATIKECTWIPKACGDPIIVGENVIYGSRCVPYESGDFIDAVYKSGGRIAKGLSWSWEAE